MTLFRTYKLEDLLKAIFSGGTPSTTHPEYWNGEFLWLSSGETNQPYISKTEKTITQEGINQSSTRFAPPGAVVMASAGQGKTRGQTSFLKIGVYINQSIIAMVPDETQLLAKYLYYNLQFRYDELRSSSDSSSTRGSITTELLKTLKITIPDLPTQEKIASILSAYDDAIENNNKRIKILEKMAENLYREWFVCMRFPGHETAEYENGLPKGWKRTTVEDLSSVLKRGISPEYSEVGSSRVINQKCIRSSIMDIMESRFQIKEFNQELNLIDGDTVICSTGTGTLGRVGQIFGNYPNTTFDSHITMVRAKKGIGQEYLYHTLKNLQPWFMSMGIGSTNQQELYRSTIKNAKVVFPSADLAKQFEHISRSFHQEITFLLDQTSVLRKQREMLLPRLMLEQSINFTN